MRVLHESKLIVIPANQVQTYLPAIPKMITAVECPPFRAVQTIPSKPFNK